MTLLEPALSDDALLADVASAQNDDDGGFALWWLGGSGFLVRHQGHHLLLDPYLSESLTTKYAATDKPHVRMTRRVIAPERLAFAEVATSSHNHTDHLDAETLRPLMAANPRLKVIVPAANRAFAADRLGCGTDRLTPIDAGLTVDAPPFGITGVPSAHETLDRDEQGRYRYLGYVIRFGPWTIYHSGDCVDYPELADLLAPLRVDVALLPINGRAPERRVPGNMFGAEAARLARRMGARLVIPHHYDLFAFNTASPDELCRACADLGQPVHVLRNGQRWSSARPR